MCIYIYIYFFSCGSSPFCAFAQKCVKPRCYNEKKALASFYPFGAVSYIWPFQEFPVRKSPWHFQHLQVSAQAPRTKTGGRAPWLSLRRCPWNTRSSPRRTSERHGKSNAFQARKITENPLCSMLIFWGFIHAYPNFGCGNWKLPWKMVGHD